VVTIDIYGAYAIGGLGSLVASLMVGIAHTDSVDLRLTLRVCCWALLIIGIGLGQFAFATAGAPWSVLVGAQSVLIGTALFAWGFARLAGRRLGHRSLVLSLPSLAAALSLAAWTGGITYPLAFQTLCFGVAVATVIASRNYLLRPRSSAERAVGITMAFYAATWTYGIVGTLQHGPVNAHLMNLGEPWLSLNAAVYALMPMVIGAVVLNLVNAQLQDRVRVLVETDELTGLLSRRGLKSRYPPWRALRVQGDCGVAVLLIDIDRFKRVNDEFGHDVGDLVLKHVAQVIVEAAGDNALVSRHGGEEFLVLTPASNEHLAHTLAERIRTAVAASPLMGQRAPLHVTISIGCSPWPDSAKLAEAIRQADAALYEAKRTGRNRVVDATMIGDLEPATAMAC